MCLSPQIAAPAARAVDDPLKWRRRNGWPDSNAAERRINPSGRSKVEGEQLPCIDPRRENVLRFQPFLECGTLQWKVVVEHRLAKLGSPRV